MKKHYKIWLIFLGGMLTSLPLFSSSGSDSQVLSPPLQADVLKIKREEPAEISEQYLRQKSERVLQALDEFLVAMKYSSSDSLRFDPGSDSEDESPSTMRSSLREKFFSNLEIVEGIGICLSQVPKVLMSVGKYASLRFGKKVLDLGGGRGFAGIFLASLFGVEVVAVEYDQKLWAFSEDFRQFAEKKGIIREGQVQFLKGDFLEHPWSGYDVIHYYALGTRRFAEVAQKAQEKMSSEGIFVYSGSPKHARREINLLRQAGLRVKIFGKDEVSLVTRGVESSL